MDSNASDEIVELRRRLLRLTRRTDQLWHVEWRLSLALAAERRRREVAEERLSDAIEFINRLTHDTNSK